MPYINWVDVLMVGILTIGILTGKKSDLFSELFILIGILFATCLSLHFYTRFGEVLSKNFFIPSGYKNILGFVILAGVTIGLFYLIRGGWLVIIKMQLNATVDRWGSLIFSFTKSYFLAGIVFFALSASGNPNIQSATKNALSAFLFKKVSVSVYSGFYTGFVGILFPDEPLNQNPFYTMDRGKR